MTSSLSVEKHKDAIHTLIASLDSLIKEENSQTEFSTVFRNHTLFRTTEYFKLSKEDFHAIHSLEVSSASLASSLAVSITVTRDLLSSFVIGVLAGNILPDDNFTAKYDSRLRSSLRNLIKLYIPIQHNSQQLLEPAELIRSKVKDRGMILLEAESLISIRLYDEFRVKHLTDSVKEKEKEEKPEDTSKQIKKYATIGAATVTGAAIVGLTGGLAAPFIGLGLGSLLTAAGVGGSIMTGVGLLSTTAGTIKCYN